MFILPDLPYSFDALEPFIDKETMSIHHDKHHAAYVKNLNDALTPYPDLLNESLENLLLNLDDLVPEEIRQKVKNNAGGHFNHSFFWKIMCSSENSQFPSTGKLSEIIKSNFGSLENFKEKFTAQGMARFGSGWVWLVIKDDTVQIVDTPNQDPPLSINTKPLLGLDLWEHAYYLKYKNMRADYINAFWNIVNWEFVETNLLKEGEKL